MQHLCYYHVYLPDLPHHISKWKERNQKTHAFWAFWLDKKATLEIPVLEQRTFLNGGEKKRIRKSERAEGKKIANKSKNRVRGSGNCAVCVIKCQFSKETNERSHVVTVTTKARLEMYTAHLPLYSPHHLAPSNSDSRLGGALSRPDSQNMYYIWLPNSIFLGFSPLFVCVSLRVQI